MLTLSEQSSQIKVLATRNIEIVGATAEFVFKNIKIQEEFP